MNIQVKETYRDADSVVNAPLADLAAVVLRYLAHTTVGNGTQCQRNFLLEMKAAYGGNRMAAQAFAEAWGWLEINGLICQHPDHLDPGWITVTRLGSKVNREPDFEQWLRDRELPSDLVHPLLRGDVLALFRQRRFDTAVFEAFKALEVRIRQAAGLGPELIGTRLASRAFHPDAGELTDREAEAGERQALQNLMVGALGSYKNPQSHRHVGLDAAEAREMIIIASHLLRIVDDRQPKT